MEFWVFLRDNGITPGEIVTGLPSFRDPNMRQALLNKLPTIKLVEIVCGMKISNDTVRLIKLILDKILASKIECDHWRDALQMAQRTGDNEIKEAVAVACINRCYRFPQLDQINRLLDRYQVKANKRIVRAFLEKISSFGDTTKKQLLDSCPDKSALWYAITDNPPE